ncbi:MAG: hypothetical protein PVF26_14210 [Desulfobacterales bacterium]|jgi:hypothetical protein
MNTESHEKIKLRFSPAAPKNIDQLDIPQAIVEDIILRHLYTKSSSSLNSLCDSLKLSLPIVQDVFQRLRKQQLFEVTGMQGNDYNFTLSGIGRERASKLFDTCQYSGPVPVSIENYIAAVNAQALKINFNRSFLEKAFSDLVLTDTFLDQLGPALMTQKPIFFYGPTGNGKTSVAIRLFRVYQDAVLIPYALEFDGQIIVLYDPSVHQNLGIKGSYDLDPRWALCRRPCIIVGGELEPKMLELQMEESSKVYAAPLQLKANNGILIIDDFGRQIISPQFLLNRWIVPLDRRVDYLTLQYGVKFQIPFEMIVLFSTNLDPNDLADPAFLRRIQNKIYVEPVNSDVFDKIFYRLVEEGNLTCEPNSAAFLRELCQSLGSGDLQACIPADIIEIVTSIDRYEGRPLELSKENLRRAAMLYFTKPQTFEEK